MAQCGAVAAHVLDGVTRDNLDLSLQVLHHLEHEVEQEERTWQLRLERARQDAARAARQYDLVEPENRLVVRTLERRWEEKLAELAELEHAYDEDRRRPRLELDTEQRARILRLAQDLPAVWNAPTTRPEERKELLGLLNKQVALVPGDVPRRQTRVRVLWHGGATTELVIERSDRYDAIRTSDEVLRTIRELMPDHTDAQVAQELNRRVLRTGRGRTFDRVRVYSTRHRFGLWRRDKDKRRAAGLEPREDGRYSTRGVAHLVGVAVHSVHHWRQKGLIPAVQESERGAWWHELTPQLIEDLRNRARSSSSKCPPPRDPSSSK